MFFKGSQHIFLLFFLLMGFCNVFAQRERSMTVEGNTQTTNTTFDRQGRPVINRNKGNDSLKRRDDLADSITIFYRYYDSSAIRLLDSSINDFAKRFQQPYTYLHLGNYGTAARSMVFNPLMKAGFDAGFHQYDIYDFTVENTKIYQTTKPYTELAYVLGAKAEQTIHLQHTQNKQTNFNFGFEYKFINSPGAFKNQNNNHNNIRAYANYVSKNKRYGGLVLFISNKHVSSENGGLQNAALLDSLAFNNPFQLETRLGPSGTFSQSPFRTNITTGNRYKNSTVLLRQYYDMGKTDSIYNAADSVYNKIFYSRFRLQHILQVKSMEFEFVDGNVRDSNYLKYFNLTLAGNSNIRLYSKWNIISNEISTLTYPDKNNAAQFIKLGATLQNIQFNNGMGSNTNYNIMALAEYRNRTKNKKWDAEIKAELYVNGLNAGDYFALITLKRELSKKAGYLQVGFNNVNRTPSAIYNDDNQFLIQSQNINQKENNTRLFVVYDNPKKKLQVGAEYYLMNNFTYLNGFFSAEQEQTLVNVLHLNAAKQFKLAKHINWYAEVHVQQATANAPVNLPLLLTRNRFAFEGNFFTNLFLSTGVELRYYTNYKAAGYSPFNGQFFYQNNFSIANRPEVNAFLQFRIKSFKTYVRVENLQTLIPGKGQYNFSTQHYAMNGVWLRLGVWWNFVN